MTTDVRRQKSNQLIIFLLFIVYPLGALPFIIKEIYNGRRYAFSLFAVFIGYIGLLYLPSGDFYRYVLDYNSYKSLSFEQFLLAVEGKMDYLLSFILWGLGQLQINSDISRFIYAYVGSELLFSMFYDQVKPLYSSSKNNLAFFLFIIVILYTSFIGFIFRYGLSVIFLVYGYYQIIFKHNYWNGFAALIICVLNHFSFILYVVLILLVMLLCFNGHRLLTIGCFLITVFVSADMFSRIIDLLPLEVAIVEHLMVYIDGSAAGEFLQDHSALFRIKLLLDSIAPYSLCVVFLVWFTKSKWSGVINIAVAMVAAVSFSVTLKTRFEWVLTYLLMIYVLNYITCNWHRVIHYRKTILVLMLCSGCIYTASSLWGQRRQLSLSMEYKLLYSSSPAILCSTYTTDWLNLNIDSDGAPRVNF